MKNINERTKQLLNTIQQSRNLTRIFTDDLGKATKSLKRLVQQTKLIDSIDNYMQNLRQQEEDFRKRIIEFENNIYNDNYWLYQQDWLPLMHAPLNAATKLKKSCLNKKPDEISRILNEKITNYYDRSLIRKEILGNWKKKKFLSNRYPIIRSAVEAHIRSEYALSTVAILPQLEGLMAEHYLWKGESDSHGYKKCLLEVVENNVLSGFKRMFTEFITDILLSKFYHGDPIFVCLNRHAILHGADVNYPNAATSLKAILLIDFVIQSIQFVTLLNSSVYHKAECRRLKHSSNIYIPVTEVSAIEKKLKPCQYCMNN